MAKPNDEISQVEARERGMFGWTVTPVPGLGVHCIPIGDTHDHMDEDCPCQPTKDPETGFWMHNSFDGREAFEVGERKPS